MWRGDVPSGKKRQGVQPRCQKEEATMTTFPLVTPPAQTASLKGQHKRIAVATRCHRNQHSPSLPASSKICSLVLEIKIPKFLSESSSLPPKSCILVTCQVHIFSLLFVRFQLRATRQFQKGLRGCCSIHSLQCQHNGHPDPGYNSHSPEAYLFLVELLELQLVPENI